MKTNQINLHQWTGTNRPMQPMIRYRQDFNNQHQQAQPMIRYRQDFNNQQQQAQPMIRHQQENYLVNETSFSESDQLEVQFELKAKRLIDLEGKEKAIEILNSVIESL